MRDLILQLSKSSIYSTKPRNQFNDEIPQLFVYSQLLLSINGHDGRYGTCHTPMKFWAAWREEDITDPQMYALRNHPLSRHWCNPGSATEHSSV
ncbi:Uncharacterised protein [Klebsiella pneumoniae]|nr:hypothetical protein [Klebsiella pneumoniae]VGG32031.1 Uncharacterised protein [Klebsiella pneumoniae]